MTVPQDTLSIVNPSFTTDTSTFDIVHTHEQMNKILIEASMSRTWSPTKVSLKHQSKSSFRRLLSKLNRGAQIFQGIKKKKLKILEYFYHIFILERLAESLAPGQKDELLEMTQLQSGTHNERGANMIINSEIINNLKEIYTLHVERRMPSIEQVKILSLLPHSISYENIMVTFGCSRHAIKSAHRMQNDNESFLQSEKRANYSTRCRPSKKSNILLAG